MLSAWQNSFKYINSVLEFKLSCIKVTFSFLELFTESSVSFTSSFVGKGLFSLM